MLSFLTVFLKDDHERVNRRLKDVRCKDGTDTDTNGSEKVSVLRNSHYTCSPVFKGYKYESGFVDKLVGGCVILFKCSRYLRSTL